MMVRLGVVFATVLVLTSAAWTGFQLFARACTPPAQGWASALDPEAWTDSQHELTFAVIGDFGTGCAGQLRVARRMAETYRERPFSLLLTAGDNVYGGDVVDRAADVIDRPYKPLFDAGVGFRPALGNHDVDGRADLPETLAALRMPQRYYSFTKGPVDFFALDSNRMDRAQLKWLLKGLSCSESPWQVVYMHHPIYSSGRHGSDRDLRDRLEPVLIEGGADLVIAGHDHNYERTTPRHGIVHIVSGGAAKLRGVGSSSFTVVSESQLHFLLAEASERSIEIEAVAVDGTVIDSFVVSLRSGGAATHCHSCPTPCEE